MKMKKYWMSKLCCVGMGAILFLGSPVWTRGEAMLLAPEEPETVSEAKPKEITLDTGSSKNEISSQGVIQDHIYLESIDLSGLTYEEAQEKANQRMEEISGYQILLHMDDQVVGAAATDLGVTGNNDDIIADTLKVGQTGNVIKRYQTRKELEKKPLEYALQYQVNPDAVRNVLEEKCIPLNREMTAYNLSHDNGVFKVINGVRGVTLKEEESVQTVVDYLEHEWKDGIGNVDLKVDIVEPEGSLEELSKIQKVLGQGSTDYSASSAARAKNIRNGASKLTGHVLYPGETFSVCDNMVPFTEENGYELAPSYANGTVVESFGGGICQVSTTLYLAVLRAELDVVERHNHSMIVSYVKPSMDAAIAEGAKDFKFTNNLDAPIYIEGYAASGNISFAIYGEEYREEGRSVSYKSETLETINPTTELRADTEKAYGSISQTQTAHTGYRAKLWKVVTVDGVETEKEEVNESFYQMSPSKYSVGVKTTNVEAQSAMYAAIGSNDVNQVYATLSKYGG